MAGSGCNAYQIRKIYAIGGALGMVKRNEEDDLLHELVESMTGKKSIKALTYSEACKVIGELEGRQGTPPPRKSGKPLRKTAPGHTSEGQRRKVWALMYAFSLSVKLFSAMRPEPTCGIWDASGTEKSSSAPYRSKKWTSSAQWTNTQATASYSQPMAMPYISMTSWWPLPLPVCRNRSKAF